jgi:hypothetical protein
MKVPESCARVFSLVVLSRTEDAGFDLRGCAQELAPSTPQGVNIPPRSPQGGFLLMLAKKSVETNIATRFIKEEFSNGIF